MDKDKVIKKLDEWLDIINFWEDEIQEIAENYDCMYEMYEKYDKMIEEMYNLYKKLKEN